MSKPDVAVVMAALITRIRRELPFDLPESQVCDGPCEGCSVKLLAYMESELDHWEHRLACGERVGLADLSKLGRTAEKIHRVLAKNRLMD